MADCLTLEYFSGYSVQYCLFFLEMCCVTVSVHCQVLYGLFVCSVHCGNSRMVVWTVRIMLQWCCHCHYYAPTQHLGQLPPSRPPELCGLQSHPCMDIDLPWSVGAYHLVAHVLTFVSMSTNILARRAGAIINFSITAAVASQHGNACKICLTMYNRQWWWRHGVDCLPVLRGGGQGYNSNPQ